MIPAYAELHCVSNFSFLRGASHPQELVQRAYTLGYSALAITDECSLAGVVRAYQAMRELPERDPPMRLIIGAEFRLPALFESATSPTGQPASSPPRRRSRPAGRSDAPDPALHRYPARLVLLACNRNGYGNLSELISAARQRAPKGSYQLLRDDLVNGLADCLALLVPDRHAPVETIAAQAAWLGLRFAGRCWIATELLLHGDDPALLEKLGAVSALSGQPLVAAGDAEFHLRSRKSLQDVLTAIRLRRTVRQLGSASAPNAEQHLRSRLRLGKLYPPELLAATVEIADKCQFSLGELQYEYPEEIVPPGETPTSWLAKLTERGLAQRYPGPDGAPAHVRQLVDRELTLIAELKFEPYFLTVADIVRFARSQGILCQGRGSAANSAVCYCLFITEVNPSQIQVLFERFISKERHEPPDIDVDFEHQRREEVIQYIYERYGRHRAALTATVISYRPRSTMRDVGKALGIEPQRVDLLSRSQQWWDGRKMTDEKMQANGFDASSLTVRHWIGMTNVLLSFPRHLSQHTGGFVIARDKLTRLVPIENAAMVDRSVIEWDKDDLDCLGLLKVDVLALGMLSAIRRSLQMIGQRRGLAAPFTMQQIPDGDPATYAMIQRADTIGVFQIESRAQMSMLPRLRPENFYDLVIEVAIVRPGPIQGGMVHPYLRRRRGLEAVPKTRTELEPALGRTLGIPIFQEQVMQIAMIAADFTAGEADRLRRAMAAWKRKGGLDHFYPRLSQGMQKNGYDQDFIDRLFKMMLGFGDYGFPESHAASFALLVYVSCWIKQHEPAAFLAGLLNSQPMGFYAPAQLVRDARAHGVEVRPVDVSISNWESTLEEQCDEPMPPLSDPRVQALRVEPDGFSATQKNTVRIPTDEHLAIIDPRPQPALRLGLNRIKGFREADAKRLIAVRDERRRQRSGTCPSPTPSSSPTHEWALPAFQQPEPVPPPPLFDSVEDLARSVGLDRFALQLLAAADALSGLAGHRHQAQWEAAGLAPMPEVLSEARFDEDLPELPGPTEGEAIIADYASLGIPMGRHPLALLRSRLDQFGIRPAAGLRDYPHGRIARASGLVTHRQRPETAKGTIFVTLEDETGAVNVIVHPDLVERYRQELLGSSLMTVYGVWQRDDLTGSRVMHLVARRIVDHSWMLGRLDVRSRDFH